MRRVILLNQEEAFSRKSLKEFQEKKLKYCFKDISLLEEALTHSSYANEHTDQGVKHNERLEFLGDAVLGAVISKFLFKHESELPEGKMTRIRSLTVREESLAAAAKVLDLTAYMRFGQGEEKSQGRQKPSNAADAMEAVFAAVFLDGGYDEAERLVRDTLKSIMTQALEGKLIYDYKSRLYEYLQSMEVNPQVDFVLLNTEGPAHDRRFTCAVHYKDKLYPSATAGSKKSAEQEAAHLFLNEVLNLAGETNTP